MTWQTTSTDSDDTLRLGEILGNKLLGGEVIELVSDLGGGKTTFVRGLARGCGSRDNVASPTFTLSRIYKCPDGRQIHHFDFYRLNEPGILADQLAESINDKKVITVVEWSTIVKEVLLAGKLTISFQMTPNSPDERIIKFDYPESCSGIMRETQSLWRETRP